MTLLNSYQKTYLQNFRSNRRQTPILLVKETLTESGDIFGEGDNSSTQELTKSCVLGIKRNEHKTGEGGFYTDEFYQIVLSLDDLDDIQASGVNVYFIPLIECVEAEKDITYNSKYYKKDDIKLKLEEYQVLHDTNELIVRARQL